MTTFRFALLVLVLSLAFVLVACGPPPGAQPPPTPRQPSAPDARSDAELLGGRLKASVPADATISPPRQGSIMAAPQASQDESGVILEKGASGEPRFGLLARELYVTASGDVTADAGRLAHTGEQAVAFTCGAGLPCALIRPTAPPKGGRLVFVLAAITQSADGLLQEVQFLLAPDLADKLDRYRSRAESIARSLSAGPRKIDRSGGEKKLGDDLVVEVPQGWIATTQRGPDFDVHRILKPQAPNQSAPVLGVYVGGHPSTQAAQSGGAPKTSSEAGTLLGRDVTWILWKREDGARVREGIVEISAHLFVHAFAVDAGDADDAELAKILATLRTASAPK